MYYCTCAVSYGTDIREIVRDGTLCTICIYIFMEAIQYFSVVMFSMRGVFQFPFFKSDPQNAMLYDAQPNKNYIAS